MRGLLSTLLADDWLADGMTRCVTNWLMDSLVDFPAFFSGHQQGTVWPSVIIPSLPGPYNQLSSGPEMGRLMGEANLTHWRNVCSHTHKHIHTHCCAKRNNLSAKHLSIFQNERYPEEDKWTWLVFSSRSLGNFRLRCLKSAFNYQNQQEGRDALDTPLNQNMYTKFFVKGIHLIWHISEEGQAKTPAVSQTLSAV